MNQKSRLAIIYFGLRGVEVNDFMTTAQNPRKKSYDFFPNILTSFLHKVTNPRENNYII